MTGPSSAAHDKQQKPGAAAEGRAAHASPAALEALDWAFRFATAIRTDPKDRGRAQESVVESLSSLGDFERAVGRAGEIEDWRRGTAYADLAVKLALLGRVEESRALIGKAEAWRTTIEGWQNPRIAAHISEAQAALGEIERAKSSAAGLDTEDKQYHGRAAVIEAEAYAAAGQAKKAMEILSTLDSETDFDTTYWRTTGYLNIARHKNLPREQREEALAAARASAGGIPGWQKAQSLEDVGAELLAIGKADAAREAIQAAEDEIAPLSRGMTMKAALLSSLARSWAALGQRQHAVKLLDEALGIVPEAMVTEKPALYASVAAGFAASGEHREAVRVYGLALDAAESLKNARPRALSLVAICRSLATSGLAMDEAMRDRLGKVFAGLKDPW